MTEKVETSDVLVPIEVPEVHPDVAKEIADLIWRNPKYFGSAEKGDEGPYETYEQATYSLLVCAFQYHVRSIVSDTANPSFKGSLSDAIDTALGGLNDYRYDGSLWVNPDEHLDQPVSGI